MIDYKRKGICHECTFQYQIRIHFNLLSKQLIKKPDGLFYFTTKKLFVNKFLKKKIPQPIERLVSGFWKKPMTKSPPPETCEKAVGASIKQQRYLK
ncbi:hypothetical protein BLM37_00315 [Candidatus Gracilibacteria bacterium GN02-873]|nr:hypothetical protein BLM37_00315 [Candidatus Gracilibacteria bacterium GN02-873]